MQDLKFHVIACACALSFVVTAHAQDNAAQAAARAAVIAQLAQLDNTKPAPVAPAPKPAPVAPVVVAPAVIAPVVVSPTPVVAVTNQDNAAQAQARAVLVQPAPAPVAPIAAPVVVAVAPAPTTKAGRLQALNAQYKANQIAPQNYYIQREAILSGN